MNQVLSDLGKKLEHQLAFIYQGIPLNEEFKTLADTLIECMKLTDKCHFPQPFANHWSEQDVVMITYGDSVIEEGIKPLKTLQHFITDHVKDSINSVHILPFFPYSSDDGFSVIDYSLVNEGLGNWQDIQAIASKKRLMSDLVINHCSSRSIWFDNFIKGSGKGSDFFYTGDPTQDYSLVVRPRTSPLLKTVMTASGEQHVWCTFSHDQVDFDFRNPEVLIEFVRIIRLYLDYGVRIFRLDAVAFLWKEQDRDCINLVQTHEVVRLLRSLIEHAQPDAIIITETNIPNTQNLTYFGNANEAHCIYNFSVPPLLINTLITGNCLYLKRWLMSMPAAQNGTCYFNFLASHDGIGLRPVEGLLNDQEVTELVDTMTAFGGKISWRMSEDGTQKAYEMNIALYDALKGTIKGEDDMGMTRFLCAHVIMMGLEGMPAFYIHSLLGTRNDYKKLENTHHNRAINRHRWDYQALEEQLADEGSDHARVFQQMLALIDIRRAQAAFHPNAIQFTLHLGHSLFGFWRQSQNRHQSIFCISNISDQSVELAISELNLSLTERWSDLLSDLEIHDLNQMISLEPYQSIWLTNRKA